MIYKDKFDAITRLTAAEFEGMTALQKLAMQPGLISLVSTLGNFSVVDDTIVRMNVIADGDAVVTGGGVCLAWLTRDFDFATAGPGGGAMPAGTYVVYLRVAEYGGTGARSLRCYPVATTQAESYDVDDAADPDAWRVGTVNPAHYLVVRTGVVWSGTAITNTGADARAEAFGPLDLTRIGRGDADEIIIGAGRNVRITGDLRADVLRARALSIDDDGIVNLGIAAHLSSGVGAVWGLGSSNASSATKGYFYLGKGATIQGAAGTGAGDPGITIDLQTWGTIIVGDNGEVNLLAGSDLNISGVIYIKDGAIAFFQDGSETYINDGSLLAKVAGSQLLFGDEDFDGIPEPGEFTGAQMVKAWARVNAAGTVLTSFNIDGCVHVADSGYYLLSLKRACSATGGILVTSNGSSGDDAETSLMAQWYGVGGDTIVVRTNQHVVVDGTPPQHGVEDRDVAFTVVVIGGVYAS